jgi:thioredoxin reductase
MRVSLGPWPQGTEDFVGQNVLEEYIQGLAERYGVNAVTQYHTRVEELRKDHDGWTVRTTTLKKGASSGPRLSERRWSFDAVVIASGHYHMPRIPDLSGLDEWKRAYPTRVWHSKRYRSPSVFQDQNVLLIGAGVSSLDIAKESAVVARHVYQSARAGLFDLPASMLPEGASRVGPIKSFQLDIEAKQLSDDRSPIPGKIVLKNGDVLTDVHSVVLGTGYITSYPFLSHLHRDDITADQADDKVLVTAEGDMNHNLHKDMFYIEDPSLVFIGVPYHVATFSLFDFQAQVVARVLSGKAQLPNYDEMRREYAAKVARRGLGRTFHSLKGGEESYVQELVDWVNRDARRLGIPEMIGHTTEWHEAKKERDAKMKLIFAAIQEERRAAAVVAEGGLSGKSV